MGAAGGKRRDGYGRLQREKTADDLCDGAGHYRAGRGGVSENDAGSAAQHGLSYVIIVTSDPGASPESIEQSITRPVEQSMATLDKIKTVTSTSQDSVSMVTLEFEDGANMDTISVDIQQKISVLQGSWDDTVSAPMC